MKYSSKNEGSAESQSRPGSESPVNNSVARPLHVPLGENND